MGLKTRNKVDPTFNMSALADVIFLLLIFFLLTSRIVPKATPVTRPSTVMQTDVSPVARIAVTRDMQYSVNGQTVNGLTGVRGALRSRLTGEDNPVVMLDIDRALDIQKLFDLYNIAHELKFQLVVATERP